MNRTASAWFAAALLGGPCLAQTAPPQGIRPAELRTHAIVDATVVVAPGRTVEHATVVIRDGVIAAVGADATVPPGARLWPASGLTVYPGLIDAAVLVDPAPDVAGEGAHWNSRVWPQRSMAAQNGPDKSKREALRALGFTAAAIYPSKGIFRGSGAVIALADDEDHLAAYLPRAAAAVGFDQGDFSERSYPGSLMGVIALIRQTFYDAQWYEQCLAVWRSDPQGVEPPQRADALAALADAIAGRQVVLFDVDDELDALRAARIAEEFSLKAALLGSGYEFRRLEEIAATGLPVIVPVDFPSTPAVASLLEADDVSLREMMTWEQAPTNARRLAAAGVTVALTTHRLGDVKEFPAALRNAVRHGLSEEAALAALTTAPAQMLGLENVLGTIEPGKAANLVVVEGSIFERRPKVRDTWVNGRRYEVSREPEHAFAGKGTLSTSNGIELPVEADTKKSQITARLPEGGRERATDVVVQRERVSFVLDGRAFGTTGKVRLTGLLAGGRIAGTGALPGGERFTFAIEPAAAAPENAAPGPGAADAGVPDPAPGGEDGAARDEDRDGARDRDGGDAEEEDDDGEEPIELPPDDLVRPLGAYGLSRPPATIDVLVTNAVLWTCGPQGIIERGSLYVRDGRIVSVGPNGPEATPDGVLVIDARGRHVTPGLIDCHSHTGISGGVNEGTQAVTAEVRIGDVVNPDDINWYHQLAGGLTACNQLHGSANPIGGQNSVVKVRWSQPPDGFTIEAAPAGIKFALGENVKRSADRYPGTRMGVEAIIRDAFEAAIEYRARLERYAALDPQARARTMPPRRDLELDALVEILEGSRLVHCHSYRQDEILMLIRLADELGFTIGTFQHVLEGYKVADAIARHGAGASSFSDWWAYKVEVMDAIPYNGALMQSVGVLVSFNSDSSELARRMNTEAAKAVRYGGLDPQEALKFVTINPAKQLRVDGRIGSLEPGKDADFVIWSESPLSTFARCEQTWIEGALYFDLAADQALRQQVAAERERLTQKIMSRKKDDRPARGAGGGERGRWRARPVEDEEPYSCSHEEEVQR
jgi:N-acetylglucosamine-6-phosphate deacetylase